MTNKIKISLVAALVAVATAGGAAMLAQDAGQPQRREGQGPRGGPGMGGPMRGPGGPGFGFEFRGLDLSDDQRAQLRKIRESHEAEFRQVGEKMRTAREGMRDLIEAEAMQILTSEQQQKLKELRAQRQNQPMKRRGQ